MEDKYYLRATIRGHAADVRALAASNDEVYTGSRDKLTKRWTSGGANTSESYRNTATYSGHGHFVSAVCLLGGETPEHVVTGSNDKTIRVYEINSGKLTHNLSGHLDSISALVGLGSSGTGSFCSGSWDRTAKVWRRFSCVATLKGHEAAVWAVLECRYGLLTASADKLVLLWEFADSVAKVTRRFVGHTDCVRGLAGLGADGFVSCSNDTTLRLWRTETGECYRVLSSHRSFVYSVCVLTRGLVSVGEEGVVCVWTHQGELAQTLALPACSVWAVASLGNGDFAVGCSDGTARVFTATSSRVAPAAEREAYTAETATFRRPETVAGDKINIDSLPGEEDLDKPGVREGQTKLVRAGGKAWVYNWSTVEGKWVNVGEVVEEPSGTVSKKVWYEGREFDYVFDVDIQEGAPTLKLPYNVSEEPWAAAQRFLQDNNLSPLFLDQVGNFIVENSKSSRTAVEAGRSVSNAVSDPITGSNRYIPGPHGAPAHRAGPPACDPLTGGSRYIPRGGHTAAPQAFASFSEYITFNQANVPQILKKIEEFNTKVPFQLKLQDSDFHAIENLANLETKSETSSYNLEVLSKLFQWPPEFVFPVVDILRLAVRSDALVSFLVRDAVVDRLFDFLSAISRVTKVPANHMLACRVVANLFASQHGCGIVGSHSDRVIGVAMDAYSLEGASRNYQLAQSSVLANLSLFLLATNAVNDTDLLSTIVLSLAELLCKHKDPDSIVRLLTSLGTLANISPIIKALIVSQDDLLETIKALQAIGNEKVYPVVTGLLSHLQ